MRLFLGITLLAALSALSANVAPLQANGYSADRLERVRVRSTVVVAPVRQPLLSINLNRRERFVVADQRQLIVDSHYANAAAITQSQLIVDNRHRQQLNQLNSYGAIYNNTPANIRFVQGHQYQQQQRVQQIYLQSQQQIVYPQYRQEVQRLYLPPQQLQERLIMPPAREESYCPPQQQRQQQQECPQQVQQVERVVERVQYVPVPVREVQYVQQQQQCVQQIQYVQQPQCVQQIQYVQQPQCVQRLQQVQYVRQAAFVQGHHYYRRAPQAAILEVRGRY